MIASFDKSASFRNNLAYWLNDKLTAEGDVQYKQRAEVVRFNQCYGTEAELAEQFKEVAQHNRNTCKPYFHVTLSLPPQDRLTNSQWADISDACAKNLGFADHQYVAILHRDKTYQHVHLLMNRIGFEGEVVKDVYLLPKVSQFCRDIEKEYQLTQQLGPRRYRTEEQRLQPETNKRIIHLKEAIGKSLQTACNYPDFEEGMKQQGYHIHKSERGIAFYHEKPAVHRGFEAGYPWKKIEGTLQANEARRLQQVQEQAQQQAELLRQAQQDLSQRLEREHVEERRQGHRMRMH